MANVNISIPKKKKITLTNNPQVVASYSINPKAKANIYNVVPQQAAGTAIGATVRAPIDNRSDDVRRYDAMSGREQKDYLSGLTALSNRRDFKSAGDIDSSIWASSALRDIQDNTTAKDAGFSWSDIGEGITQPLRSATGKIVNSFREDSRLQEIDALYREGKISKEEAAFAAQNIYRDSIDSKVEVAEDGKLNVVAKNPLEFGGGFTKTGVDLAANYSPIGAGYSQVARQGLKMAAKPLLRETLAYSGAMTGNDVVQGRDVTAGSIAMNTAAAFGGSALGAGIGIPQGMRAARQQNAAAAGLRSNLMLGNVALRDAVHIIDNAADDLARQAAEVPTPTQAAPQQPVVNEPVVSTQVEEPLLTRPEMPEQAGQTTPSYLDAPNEFMTNSRIAREEARTRYDENPSQRALDLTMEQLYDPLYVAQRYDNEWFNFARENNLIREGQKELLKTESFTGALGDARNPQRTADTLMDMKYETDIGELSFNDIVRKYGASNSERAQRLQDYRMFKDELWRIEHGEKNTLPDTKRRMEEYVEKYEAENPDVVYDNAVLRAHELTLDKMMEDAGILEQGTTARFAENPFYTRRTKAKPDNSPSMEIKGGMRAGVKQVSERTEMNAQPAAELSDMRKATAETVRSIANARLGKLVKQRIDAGAPGMEGFKLELDADVMRYHKQMLDETRKLKKEYDELRQVRDVIKKEKRKATAKSKTADKKANAATRKHEKLKKQETKERVERAKAREDAIVRHVDRLLEMARRDQAKRKLSGQEILDRERSGQQVVTSQQTVSDLVDAKLTREEKIAIGEVLARDFTAPEVTAKTTKDVASAKRQRISKKRLSTKLQNEVDALNSMVENSRQMVNDAKTAHHDAYKEFSDTTQYVGPNKNRIYYTSNGELGVIDAPGDFANSISRNNMQQTYSLIEQSFRGLSNLQKVVWTGALNPAWNVYNVAIKNPTLMFFNADGLSGIRPAVWQSFIEQAIEPIYGGTRMKNFKQEMGLRNATRENAFQTRRLDRTTTDDIARRANIVTFMEGAMKHPIRTIGDLWKGLNAAVAKLPNMQRTTVEYGAYKRARGLGWSEQEALDYAAGASARVFGDFDRVTKLAQAMEPLIPYSGATQAGTRALWRTAKTKPVEAAIKATVLGVGMIGISSYSIKNSQEYFEDMVEQEQEYKLDNNLVFVLPGARKNADGTWSGVFHIPLVPDFRPTWRSIWRTIYKLDKEGTDGLDKGDAGMIAGELFNQVTGDMSNQIYDAQRGEENAVMGAFPGSATVNVVKTLGGINTYNGGELGDDYFESLPADQQVRSYTSDTAKTLSAISQGLLSPVQIDQLFAAGGTAGDIVQQPGEGLETLGESFIKPFRPGTSRTEKKKGTSDYFDRRDKVLEYAAGIGDEQLYNQLKAHFSGKTEKQDDDLLKNAKTISQYFSISGGKFRTTSYWDAMKLNEMLARDDGKDANPIFDLKDDQLKRVLVYRASRMLNATKQSYDKDGNSLYTSLGLDEKWYDDFRDKESAYYDAIEKKIKKELDNETDPEKKKELQASYDRYSEDDPKTFSGTKKPKLTKEQDKLMDYYYTLPKGTGDRSAFIDSHPWILDYWDALSGFNIKERNVLGLKNWDVLENGSSSSSSSSSGGSSSSSSRRKAKGKSSSRSSGSSSEKTLNPNQYAINPLAGGQIASPTVRRPAKGKAVKAYTARGKAAAPKMTVQKSKV